MLNVTLHSNVVLKSDSEKTQPLQQRQDNLEKSSEDTQPNYEVGDNVTDKMRCDVPQH